MHKVTLLVAFGKCVLVYMVDDASGSVRHWVSVTALPVYVVHVKPILVSDAFDNAGTGDDANTVIDDATYLDFCAHGRQCTHWSEDVKSVVGPEGAPLHKGLTLEVVREAAPLWSTLSLALAQLVGCWGGYVSCADTGTRLPSTGMTFSAIGF